MNENRRQILEMLAAGKITADEAERLMSALEAPSAASAGTNGATATAVKPRPKYLRVMVHDESRGKSPTEVNVRIPMQLLRAGVRLASLIPVQARDQVNDALREKGIQVDLTQIKPENLEELVDQLSDLTVDVDDKHAKVRVFCE
jgi:polyhydroxyalkanoate synthesis regulator phasin